MPTIEQYAKRDDACRIRVPHALGRNLRARRLAVDMSQQTLAQCAGTTNQYISDIECGASVPSLRVLATLALALECTLVELFAGVPPEELL